MNRKSKNIITILILVILIAVTGITIKFAIDSKKSTSSSGRPEMSENGGPGNMGEPPDMNSNSSSMGEPPEKPSNDNQSNTQSQDNSSNDNKTSGQPPEMPNGEMPSGAPDMNNNSSNNSGISTIYYVLFSVEGLAIGLVLAYLIMSNFNKKSTTKTLGTSDKKIIYALASLVIALSILGGSILLSDKINSKDSSSSSEKMPNNGSESSNVEASGSVVVTGTETLSDKYETTTSDESSILVKDGGKATISGATITKSGDSSNTENSEFYGINAGILVTKNSEATIKNATITISAKGANAVFSTGESSKIYISDSTINTTGSSSARGLDATYGGYIEADNVTITTKGGSCATLATDRGEGTVKVTNSKLETNGSGSPVIYSTGDISIKNTTGVANGSQMVVIEGKNSATVTDSTLEASAKGNRGTTDQAGIMIYQSMSGDASEGTGTFTATNSTLSVQKDSDYYKTAPMFFITNTNALINLDNTKLNYGSNILISAKGTSEWGKSGSNGGVVTFNATEEELTGNIEIDNISTLTMNLTKTSYKGTINSDNSAKSITLKLDKDSKVTLTGDSYITSLDNVDSTNSNIDFNGYKLYVNGKAIN